MLNLHSKHALIAGETNRLTGGIREALEAAGATVAIEMEPTEVGAADVLVITPPAFVYKPFLETTDAEWDTVIAGDFERAVWLAQGYARKRIAAGEPGSIIFVSSVAAFLPMPNLSAFGTTLGALRALAKMAAVDLAPHHIRVNGIECGWLDDDTTAPYLSDGGRGHVEAGTPTGRLIQPSEVGALCAFLASDLASGITGAMLTLDGGYSLTRSGGTAPLMPAR